MVHDLKCWPSFFWAMVDGHKPFEFRKDDRGFRDGDELVLCEYEPSANAMSGRQIRATVDRVFREVPGLPSGYCLMSLKDIKVHLSGGA